MGIIHSAKKISEEQPEEINEKIRIIDDINSENERIESKSKESYEKIIEKTNFETFIRRKSVALLTGNQERLSWIFVICYTFQNFIQIKCESHKKISSWIFGKFKFNDLHKNEIEKSKRNVKVLKTTQFCEFNEEYSNIILLFRNILISKKDFSDSKIMEDMKDNISNFIFSIEFEEYTLFLDEIFQNLQSFHNLRKLDKILIKSNQNEKKDEISCFQKLANFKKLESIEVEVNLLDELFMKGFNFVSNLKKMKIIINEIISEIDLGVECDFNLPNIIDFECIGEIPSCVSFEKISFSNNLQHIFFEDTNLSKNQVKNLCNLKSKVTTLFLSCCKFHGKKSLSLLLDSYRSLRKLKIKKCKPSQLNITGSFSLSENLESVELLSFDFISTDFLRKLLLQQNLSHLSLINSNISDNFMNDMIIKCVFAKNCPKALIDLTANHLISSQLLGKVRKTYPSFKIINSSSLIDE